MCCAVAYFYSMKNKSGNYLHSLYGEFIIILTHNFANRIHRKFILVLFFVNLKIHEWTKCMSITDIYNTLFPKCGDTLSKLIPLPVFFSCIDVNGRWCVAYYECSQAPNIIWKTYMMRVNKGDKGHNKCTCK